MRTYTNRNDIIHFDFDANKPKREIINFWSNNQRNENDVQWKFITLLMDYQNCVYCVLPRRYFGVAL